ncbi:uncharacterized protein FFC1_04100 [Fusarium fujikuroi]|nr:uncharacterized protein FFC1_04100 [Fusarium fujikuroi]
MQFKNAL